MNTTIIWSPGMTLETVEELVIRMALMFYHGNKTMTAAALNVSLRTIDNKLEKYDHDDKQRKDRDHADKLARVEYLKRARGLVGADPQIPNADGVIPAQKNSPNVPSPRTGLYVEPAREAAKKLGLSVPEPAQVQSVLPKQAARGGNARRG